MHALLALAPLAVVLVAMVGLGRSAAVAAVAGLALALVAAVVGFEMPGAPEVGAAIGLAGTVLEALGIAVGILWIIFPALCIYELGVRTGAFDTLRGALASLSGDPRMLAILVAWFFGLFMEGAAGFGTPVALAAPILVTLGFGPMRAVTLALLGHAAGVSFGAVGTPAAAQVAATGLDAIEIARETALLHALLGWVLLVFTFAIAGTTSAEDRPVEGAASARRRADWLWVPVAAACFLVPFYAFAAFVGPELPTLGGALVGVLAFVTLLRFAGRGRGKADPAQRAGMRELVRAGSPYVVLLALVLFTRLVPDVRETLEDVWISWSLPGGGSGGLQPLYHPGTMLVAGFVVGGLLQGAGLRDLVTAAGAAARRLGRVVVALVAMLMLARLMLHTGMIETLAEAAAGAGAAWPLVAPFVAVLGTFVTGSATASNILFTDLQEATAERLGLPVLTMVAAQGFGAAIGNVVCPHNIIAGGATVGLGGREGEVLRRTVVACLVYTVLGGVLLLLWV